MGRKVVYRCVTGGYESVDPILLEEGWEYLFFVDTEDYVVPEGWTRAVISNPGNLDPVRLARRVKILFWEYVGPDVDVLVWVDGNVTTKKPISALVDRFLADDKSFVSKAHDVRGCAYEEGLACTQAQKDDPTIISRQLAGYRQQGFPSKFGLVESWSIIRRDTPEVRALMGMWWQEVRAQSRRDQLSFDYCRWKSKLSDIVEYIHPDLWHQHFYRHGSHRAR